MSAYRHCIFSSTSLLPRAKPSGTATSSLREYPLPNDCHLTWRLPDLYHCSSSLAFTVSDSNSHLFTQLGTASLASVRHQHSSHPNFVQTGPVEVVETSNATLSAQRQLLSPLSESLSYWKISHESLVSVLHPRTIRPSKPTARVTSCFG